MRAKLLPRVVYARRQQAALCLGFAAFAFSLRALTLVIPPVHRVAQPTLETIADDARKLGALLDAASIRALERAEGLARSPVLQAGILTDTATLADIVRTEYRIETRHYEALELFQVRGTQVSSLLRLPAKAAPITFVRGARARISDRNGLSVIVGAEIAPYTTATEVTGEIAVAIALDLSQLSLAHTTTGAHLVGGGAPVALLPDASTGEATFVVPVPLDSRSQLGPLSLHTTPVSAMEHSRWLLPVRHSALALGILFVIGFVVALRGGRRRQRDSV